MDFRVLGPVEVADCDGTAIPVGGPRARTVLAALILHANRTLPTTRLASMVWDEQPPRTAAATVHSYVCRLRARLVAAGREGADRILTGADGYRLRLESGESDAERFQRRVETARAMSEAGALNDASEELRAALALWRGPALRDVPAKFAREYAASLDEAHASATEEHLEIALRLDRHVSVVPELRMLVLKWPLRERLAGMLMFALYQSGQQAEALGVFRNIRRTLVEELGVEPSPSLQSLHQQILQNDVELTHLNLERAISSRNLPAGIDHFIGRRAEVRELVDSLSRDRSRSTAPMINTISGMAGVGKTSLAVHVAHLVADRYPDGQLFVDLLAHTPGRQPREPANALETLLLSLGVPQQLIPDTFERRTAMWRTQLAHRRTLVVLDNAASTTQVEPLLPTGKNCLVLITSRHRLGGLQSTQTLLLDALPTTEAAELLSQLIGKIRAAAEPDAVRETAALCYGLPLAIRIAAARLQNRPTWRISDLNRQLRNLDRRLNTLSVDKVSLSDTFATSYHHLGPEQRRILCLTSFHPDATFDAASAAAITSLPIGNAERLLESLVDANILDVSSFGHYRFHAMMRSYVNERAHEQFRHEVQATVGQPRG